MGPENPSDFDKFRTRRSGRSGEFSRYKTLTLPMNIGDRGWNILRWKLMLHFLIFFRLNFTGIIASYDGKSIAQFSCGRTAGRDDSLVRWSSMPFHYRSSPEEIPVKSEIFLTFIPVSASVSTRSLFSSTCYGDESRKLLQGYIHPFPRRWKLFRTGQFLDNIVGSQLFNGSRLVCVKRIGLSFLHSHVSSITWTYWA